MSARPRYDDPTLRERLTAALKAGNYIETACQYAGLGYSTYFKWMQEAKADDAPPELVEFMESVESARAQAIVRNVKLIQDAAQNGTWQAAAWWLERSQPTMWGRNDKVRQEVSGPNGGAIQVQSLDDARNAVLAFLSDDTDGDEDGTVVR